MFLTLISMYHHHKSSTENSYLTGFEKMYEYSVQTKKTY